MEWIRISYYGFVVALVMLAMFFLVMPLPKHKGIANYSVSLKFMALSYIYLSVYCMLKSPYPVDLLGAPFLFTAIFQAHLLGFSHIIMLNASRTTRGFVLTMVGPAVFLLVVLLGCVAIDGYHAVPDYDTLISRVFTTIEMDVTVRICAFIYYIGLSIYYIKTFYEERAKMKQRLNDMTVDVELHAMSLRKIHISFVLVFVILVDTVVVSLTQNIIFRAVCNFSILLLYIIIGLIFIRYPKVFMSVPDVVVEDAEVNETETRVKAELWQQWKDRIINEQLYKQPGVTASRLADMFEVSRGVFSGALNQCEGVNFNTFIKNLRIEAAKDMIMKNPDLGMMDVLTAVGYTDQANFSRHFKQVMGVPPIEWKKNHC